MDGHSSLDEDIVTKLEGGSLPLSDLGTDGWHLLGDPLAMHYISEGLLIYVSTLWRASSSAEVSWELSINILSMTQYKFTI